MRRSHSASHAPPSADTSHLRPRSLAHNKGVFHDYADGQMKDSHATDGITALCEGLKGSAVTSLECAAAPPVPVSGAALTLARCRP